jgi:hypothetical protein
MLKLAALAFGAMSMAPFGVALAQDNQATTAPTAKTKPADDVKVCRNGRPTGTRMVTRLCKTKAEWKDFDALSQSAVDTSMRRSQVEIGREDFQKTF